MTICSFAFTALLWSAGPILQSSIWKLWVIHLSVFILAAPKGVCEQLNLYTQELCTYIVANQTKLFMDKRYRLLRRIFVSFCNTLQWGLELHKYSNLIYGYGSGHPSKPLDSVLLLKDRLLFINLTSGKCSDFFVGLGNNFVYYILMSLRWVIEN